MDREEAPKGDDNDANNDTCNAVQYRCAAKAVSAHNDKPPPPPPSPRPGRRVWDPVSRGVYPRTPTRGTHSAMGLQCRCPRDRAVLSTSSTPPAAPKAQK